MCVWVCELMKSLRLTRVPLCRVTLKVLRESARRRRRAPLDQLIEPRLVVLVPLDERRVGAEHHAILIRSLSVRLLLQRVNDHVRPPQIVEVSLRVVLKRRGDRAPDVPVSSWRLVEVGGSVVSGEG